MSILEITDLIAQISEILGKKRDTETKSLMLKPVYGQRFFKNFSDDDFTTLCELSFKPFLIAQVFFLQ